MVKDPLLLPYTFIPSTSIVLPPTTPAQLSEMWTYDFKNVGEKYICFLKYSLFRTRYCQSQEILFKHHL